MTDRADSLHLTIGLHPPTRLDALRAALEACGEDVEFRRTLDAGGALPDDLLERSPRGSRRTRWRPARAGASSRAAGRCSDDQLTQARAAAALGARDAVERRPTVIAELDGAALVFEGKEVRFPPRHAAAALDGGARRRRAASRRRTCRGRSTRRAASCSCAGSCARGSCASCGAGAAA